MSHEPDWKPHAIHTNLEPYLLALGVLQRNWLDTERALEFLLWHYLKADRTAGEAITTHIGNVTRAHILLSLSEVRETSREVLAAVQNAVAVYDVLRGNRNYLAHSQMGGVVEGGVMTFRITSRGNVNRESLPVSLERIRDTADQTSNFKLHLYRIRLHVERDEPLPEKFPRPPDLLKLLRQDRDRRKP